MSRIPFSLVLLCALPSLSFAVEPAASSPGDEPRGRVGAAPITSLAFAPDGKTLIAASQGELKIFAWPKLELQRSLTVDASNVHDLKFSPNGKQLAVAGGEPSESGSIHLFDWPSGKLLRMIVGQEDSIRAVAWRDDAILAAGSLDHSVSLWDVRTGASQKTLNGHSRGVTSLCYLGKKKILVSAGLDRNLRVWDDRRGQLIRSLGQHVRRVHALAVCPVEDALPLLASVSKDRTVRFWQPSIGRMVRFARLDSQAMDLAWLADGKRVVVACKDGRVRVVDSKTVEVTKELSGVRGWAYCVAVSEGVAVVGGFEGQIRRVDLGGSKATKPATKPATSRKTP